MIFFSASAANHGILRFLLTSVYPKASCFPLNDTTSCHQTGAGLSFSISAVPLRRRESFREREKLYIMQIQLPDESFLTKRLHWLIRWIVGRLRGGSSRRLIGCLYD